jgi:hypothetical protein
MAVFPKNDPMPASSSLAFLQATALKAMPPLDNALRDHRGGVHAIRTIASRSRGIESLDCEIGFSRGEPQFDPSPTVTIEHITQSTFA